MTLTGKKILIFGGPAISADIVLAAKELGIYTIVSDWHQPKDSYAKQVADEHWEISLMNYEELSKRIKEQHIDGVMTGFSDSYLPIYQHLCEICGLPCYATKEQFEETLDKASFKKLCRQYGVPVVSEYDAADFDPKTISKTTAVLIKPVDNSGSRGIVKCEDPALFADDLEYALSFSEKKKVVIERFMDCDDVSFEYKIQDGKVFLSSICDRFIYKTPDGGSVTAGLLYPSKYLSVYMANVDQKVCDMFRGLGLKNGVLFMQAFVENENFYFYEMGYRLSGGRHYLFTENQNGTNACKELVHFAVTGSMADYSIAQRSNPLFHNLCCQLSILCKAETTIYTIIGLEELRALPQVIDLTTYYREGQTIGKVGTTAQIFARIHIVAESMEGLENVIRSVKNTLIVKNRKGENLIIDISYNQ